MIWSMQGSLHVLLLALLSCALALAPSHAQTPDTPSDAARLPHHHRAEGFQNNYIEFEPKGLLDLLNWRWQSARIASSLMVSRSATCARPMVRRINSAPQ